MSKIPWKAIIGMRKKVIGSIPFTTMKSPQYEKSAADFIVLVQINWMRGHMGQRKGGAMKKSKKKVSREKISDMRKEYDFSKGTRGAVIEGDGVKLPITIRLDGAILDHFREKAEKSGGGQGYQTLINEALREYIQGARIEALLLSDDFAEKLSRSLKKKDLAV